MLKLVIPHYVIAIVAPAYEEYFKEKLRDCIREIVVKELS